MGQNRNSRLTGQFGGRSAHSLFPAFPLCGGRPVISGCLFCGVRGAATTNTFFIDKTAGEGVDSRAGEHVA